MIRSHKAWCDVKRYIALDPKWSLVTKIPNGELMSCIAMSVRRTSTAGPHVGHEGIQLTRSTQYQGTAWRCTVLTRDILYYSQLCIRCYVHTTAVSWGDVRPDQHQALSVSTGAIIISAQWIVRQQMSHWMWEFFYRYALRVNNQQTLKVNLVQRAKMKEKTSNQHRAIKNIKWENIRCSLRRHSQ